ncbi:MAG: amino acid permease [Chitinophagaceae bacterium]|nr:amino acid permease [Chitinophagaceae bacterium]MCW5926503.1 amino acid permease [Chitinophagaceae bacterium]
MSDSSSQLNRSLGLRLAIVIVVANIIGSGVYKKVAPMANDLHSAGWILICWLLGGIITLFGALSNAEIAGMMADTGGEYAYYKKIYGRFFSFLYGWSNFSAIKTAAISGIAYVFAQSLNSIVVIPPMLESWGDIKVGFIFYPFRDFNIKFVAILLVLVLTFLNTRGIKAGARLSSAIVVIILAGIAILVVFGLSSPQANIGQAFALNTDGLSTVSFSTMFTAMLAAFWAYEGWNSVGYLGGEIKEPHKNVPKSITLGLLIVITVYLLANIAYLSLLPMSALQEIHNTSSIAAVEAMKVFWGNGGALFMSVLILISTLGCTHATIYSSARIYCAMAEEKLFFKSAGVLNKAKVPGNALVMQGIWACVLILSGSFDQLTDMLIFAAFIYYGATSVGVFILRRKMPEAHRPYKVWGYPVVPAIFIIFCVLLIVNTIIERPEEAGVGLTLIFLGIPFYWWFNKTLKNGK